MPDASDPARSEPAAGDAPRAPQTASGPRLPDPWSRRGALPLTGYFERERFSPLLTAILVLVGAFLAFLIISNLAVIALVLGKAAASGQLTGDGLEAAMQSIGAEAVIGNSIGQVLGLALPALLAAGLHTARRRAFLRLRRVPWAAVGLALLGLAGLMPAVARLIELNQHLPLPESLRFLEDLRAQSIRMILESDLGLWANLLGLAAVPALCEELIFRGYAQRQLERAAGVWGGILLTGFFFGLYHIDPLQLLPLSVLGLYLAYLTWRTGSLWPAIVVHFANNAFAVVGAEMAASQPDVSLAEVEGTGWPWYVVLGGLILFAASLFLLHTRAPRWKPRSSATPDRS